MSEIITSSDYIIVNGIGSDTVGLYIDTPPVPPMAQQRYTDYQTGSDMDGCTPDDAFENIRLTITAYQFFPDSFDNRAVYDFLKNPKTLQISRFDEYYFKVQKISGIQPESKSNGKRIKYTISFDCKPFKYAVENELSAIEKGTITNNGNRYSRPVWIVSGAGERILWVNSQSINISGVSGNVCIDCEKMIAYTETTIINAQTTGKFPFLAVGDNAVDWNENITSVYLQKNERWY